MRVFVVAGSPIAQQPCGSTPGPADRVIAADYGAHHARAWGWPIDLLIGDLDSLPPTELQAARAAGVPMITAPAAKDETDLELAVAARSATARPSWSSAARWAAGPTTCSPTSCCWPAVS